MKMKIWDRIVLALYALLGLALVGWCGVSIVAPALADEITALLRDAWQTNTVLMIVMCAAALVLVVWTVRIFLLAFKHEPRKDKSSVAIQNTENGAVRVSVAAVDALVRQAIGNSEGVMEVKSKIFNHEDSISVKVEMTLAGNAHIPNVTMLLQRNIKAFIEEFSGIAVRDVSVLVTSIVPVEGPVAIAEKATAEDEGRPEIVVEPEVPAAEEIPAEPVAEESVPDQEVCQEAVCAEEGQIAEETSDAEEPEQQEE